MKKKSIYENQSQELLSLFEEAGNNGKVMCVPIDYAKKDHTVMFCNGHGDIFRKPFFVKNSPGRSRLSIGTGKPILCSPFHQSKTCFFWW